MTELATIMCLFLADTPSLVDFISFPMRNSKVNLAEKIGNNHHDFGVLLLNDNSGDIINSIGGNPQDFIREVFRTCMAEGDREAACNLGHSCGCPQGHWAT